jgi:hypothetical protein
MIGGACWIENVIAFALRSHHCLEIKRKLPKFIQSIQRHMKTTKEKVKHFDALPSSLIDSKGNLKYKTTKRLGVRGTLPSSQHFGGVEGHAGAPGWD